MSPEEIQRLLTVKTYIPFVVQKHHQAMIQQVQDGWIVSVGQSKANCKFLGKFGSKGAAQRFVISLGFGGYHIQFKNRTVWHNVRFTKPPKNWLKIYKKKKILPYRLR